MALRRLEIDESRAIARSGLSSCTTMPAPGYLAFPVYALECFAMYVTGAWIFSRKYVAEKKYQDEPDR